MDVITIGSHVLPRAKGLYGLSVGRLRRGIRRMARILRERASKRAPVLSAVIQCVVCADFRPAKVSKKVQV